MPVGGTLLPARATEYLCNQLAGIVSISHISRDIIRGVASSCGPWPRPVRIPCANARGDLSVQRMGGKILDVEIHVPKGATGATLTNLVEKPEGSALQVSNDTVTVTIHPYQIL